MPKPVIVGLWIGTLGLCAGVAALFAYLVSTGAVRPGYLQFPTHQLDTAAHAAPAGTAAHAPVMAASPADGVDPLLAAMVAQEIAKLDAQPKTVVVPSDQSYEALMAIRRGDYATANRIATDVLARSHLLRWSFYPFNEFMGSITRSGNDAALLENLRAWIRKDPKSAIAYLIRAEYYNTAAWTTRGEEVSAKVPRQLRDLFAEDLRLATADVQMSISLNPGIPWSYFLLMQTVSGNGNTPTMEAAFQAGIKAFPGYYELYRERLYFMTPKWGGSVKGMYAFVDRYAGSAADTSPFKLLYLHLYAYLLDAAAFDCGYLKGDSRRFCFDGEIDGTDSPELVDGTMQALNLYRVGDPAEFSTVLWPVLGQIAFAAGSSARVTALLQKAAIVMGSDNQLTHEPGHNSYVLDDIIARDWAQMGNSANAEKKYLEALDDVEHTTFSDKAREAAARAWIYDDLARFAEDNHDYVHTIAYHTAANAVGGANHGDYPYQTCFAYFKLKHYAEAVSECTRQIEGNGNYLQSRYWRARANEELGLLDAAMADFGPIADSANNWFRDGAVIEMSVILGSKRNDAAGELALLNRYPYLFDPALQTSGDLAVAFNNRCHAYMKLGLLKKALDDCNTSLRYDHIPDALQKQQELMKQLGVKAAT